MNHLNEEQLTELYYGDLESTWREHLSQCAECRASFESLRALLEATRDYPVPERNDSYGREVWARLQPTLPLKPVKFAWLNWWTMVPAVAALLVLAFMTGMLVEKGRQPEGLSLRAQERVLLLSLADHLDRSQIVLAQVANQNPGSLDLATESGRARDLIDENRLLRQTALRLRRLPEAALLDDLERVLLDVANSPADASPGEIERLQNRIEQDGLLFKVRVTNADVQRRGQEL